MSNMGFDQTSIHKMTDYLLNDLFGKEWNLNNDLRILKWDGDLKIDKKLAISFMTKKIPAVYNMKVKSLTMLDVFDKKEQQEVQDACVRANITAIVSPPPKVGGYVSKKKK